jgi:hypothetical protein
VKPLFRELVHLGKFFFHLEEGLQSFDWVPTYYSTFLLDLENFLPSKAQVFLLATDTGQTKHKELAEKEELPSTKLQLRISWLQ